MQLRIAQLHCDEMRSEGSKILLFQLVMEFDIKRFLIVMDDRGEVN
jgi:hypothetical protein